jgi:hypothetical protein
MTSDPTTDPEVSVIVVSWNTRELTRACLESVRNHARARPLEVVVVDNDSADGSVDMVRADFPEATLVVNSANLGFGRGVNAGLAVARGKHIMLLNSDTLLEDDVVDRLVSALEVEPDVGLVGAGLSYPDGRLQPSCGRFPSLGRELASLVSPGNLLGRLGSAPRFPSPFHSHADHASDRDVDWVAGACLLARAEAVEDVGPFDDRIFLFGEEWDWCWRFRKAGWRVVHRPAASVVHVGSASMESSGPWRVRALLSAYHYVLAKHRGRWHGVGYKAVTLLASSVKAVAWSLAGLALVIPSSGRSAVCRRRAVWNARSVFWSVTPGSEGLIHGPQPPSTPSR